MTAGRLVAEENDLIRSVAAQFGLVADDPDLLDRGTNLVVHFRPSPVVGRITRLAHLVRPISALAGAVALARALPDAVVAPSSLVEPGPHVVSGRYVTFWTYAPDGPASPTTAGRALRKLHESAAAFRGELRSFDPRPDAAVIADLVGRSAGDVLRAAARRLPVPTLRHDQPVHGDAHIANVLSSGRWLDPDELSRGPREWDIACLSHRTFLWGEVTSETAEALAAYGNYDHDLVAALAPLVVLFTAAWGSLAPLVGEEIGPRTQKRLAWLRENA